METIGVYDLLQRRALITRESARSIAGPLSAALELCEGEVALDFSGVEAVTPSFVDEVLGVIYETLKAGERSSLRVTVLNPPTRLSAKFAAVGRGRRLRISESPGGAWTVTEDPAAPPL
jgi:hypothetical protein